MGVVVTTERILWYCFVMKKTKSAGGVVINKKGEVLIVNQNGDSWSLPKGHIDPGETTIEAARREIREESGLTDLVFVKPLLTYNRFRIGLGGVEDKSEMKEITMFLFRVGNGGDSLKPEDPANPEARWVTKGEVSKLLTHPKDKEFFQKIAFEVE